MNFGDIVNGKYVLIKKIGYGTFSTVWLGYLLNSTTEQKYYAIKIHHQDDYDVGSKEREFLLKLKSLKCDNFVTLHECFDYMPLNSDSKIPSVCFVFDLMACSMHNVTALEKYSDGIDEGIVLSIIKQITTVLEKLKSIGYLYTDIRAENILVQTRDKRMEKFCELFDAINFDNSWKQMCIQLCDKHNYNLTKKKHKSDFNKKKRVVCKEIIQNITDTIAKELSGISKDIELTMDTKFFLTDFGSVKKNHKHNDDFNIQTRDYRAPEVLLEQEYTYKVDVWSIGCIMFEFLTGERMIRPDKFKGYSVDFNHIFWLVELFGQFPKSIAKNSKYGEKFFYTNGKFKNSDTKDWWSIDAALKYYDIALGTESLRLMKHMFELEQNKRPSFDEIILAISKHPCA